MEVGLAILLFVCMTALLYVLLSLKITRQVDLQMKEFYKTRIHSDIQEFYREMEGYAVLMENRIQRFKSLIERSEALPDRRAHEQATEQPEIPQVKPAISAERKQNKKASLQRSIAPEKKRDSGRAEKKATRAVPVKPVKGKEAKRQTEPARPVVVATQRLRPVEEHALPVQPVAMPDYSQQFSAAQSRAGTDADTTIAEELMKDLFAQDEMQLSRRVNLASAGEPRHAPAPQATKAAEPAETEKTSVTGILARIGKAFQPVVFGDGSQVNANAANRPTQTVLQQGVAKEPALSNKPADFAEILRRAEQIKAEKKAERERAEMEARAEFYMTGDEFVSTPRQRYTANEQAARGVAQSAVAGADTLKPAIGRENEVQQRQTPPRNSLAVKSLDEHTINFLIDSLKHNAGYRKQALRALTENNIPLEEIARLSRIDIGELQLMNELGKF